MVFVTVVMACCAKAKSAILRLFFAMRMLRVFTETPKPFKRGCVKETDSVDETAGLKKLAAGEDWRLLFQVTLTFVPVRKVSVNWLLYCAECDTTAPTTAAEPVPERKGLLIGVSTSENETLLVRIGSNDCMVRENGLVFAEEEEMAAPGVPNPKPPELALRMLSSASHG